MDVVQLSANTWILLNTHLFFYYLLSIFYVFPSLTLAAASPTCPSPAPWVYLMQRDGGAWCWWIGKRQGEQNKEKLHTSRAVSFWQSDLAAPAPPPRWIQLLQKQESRGEELWWGQGAQKGLGNCTWMLSSCVVDLPSEQTTPDWDLGTAFWWY